MRICHKGRKCVRESKEREGKCKMKLILFLMKTAHNLMNLKAHATLVNGKNPKLLQLD